ncbi:hypothetical protein AB0E69_03700 [Kribbella sp. NPDC026611]|uniref:hypothetical protein n=1 Tax=Kribbella sp. NPDC026611 TaxID=3154911 RepID=UPI0033F3B66A
MAPAGEPETYVPRPGDLIEIRKDAEYWQFGRDPDKPGTWQQRAGFDTDDGIVWLWVNANGADPFDQVPSDRQVVLERDVEGGEAEEFGLRRDESGELRVEPLAPEPEPLDLSGAEPFQLRSGDRVVTQDNGVFSYHGVDNTGVERWQADFAGGISAEVAGAPFRSGEAATVVRHREGDDLEFTVAQGDDGLVLVPGVEQPPIDQPVADQGGSAPAAFQTDRGDRGERAYGAQTSTASSRKQSPPSAGR